MLLPSGKKSTQYFPHDADDSGLIWQIPKPPLKKVKRTSKPRIQTKRAGEQSLLGAFLFSVQSDFCLCVSDQPYFPPLRLRDLFTAVGTLATRSAGP